MFVTREELIEQYKYPNNFRFYNCSKNIYPDNLSAKWNKDTIIAQLHIEKTAGTTVAYTIHEFCCNNNWHEICKRFHTHVEYKCENGLILGNNVGYCTYHVSVHRLFNCVKSHAPLGKVQFISVFRDPVKRAVSEYFHLKAVAEYRTDYGLFRFRGNIMALLADGLSLEGFLNHPDYVANKQTKTLLENVWDSDELSNMYGRYWYGHWLQLLNVPNDQFEKAYANNADVGLIKDILYSQFLWVGTTDDNLWMKCIKLFEKKFGMAFDKTDFHAISHTPDDFVLSASTRKLIEEKNRLDVILTGLVKERVQKELKIFGIK